MAQHLTFIFNGLPTHSWIKKGTLCDYVNRCDFYNIQQLIVIFKMASSHHRITLLGLPTCQRGEIQKNEQNFKSNNFQILDKGQKRTVITDTKGTNYVKPMIALEALAGCSAQKRPNLGGGLDEFRDRSQTLGRLRYLEFSDKNNKEKGSIQRKNSRNLK